MIPFVLYWRIMECWLLPPAGVWRLFINAVSFYLPTPFHFAAACWDIWSNWRRNYMAWGLESNARIPLLEVKNRMYYICWIFRLLFVCHPTRPLSHTFHIYWPTSLPSHYQTPSQSYLLPTSLTVACLHSSVPYVMPSLMSWNIPYMPRGHRQSTRGFSPSLLSLCPSRHNHPSHGWTHHTSQHSLF